MMRKQAKEEAAAAMSGRQRQTNSKLVGSQSRELQQSGTSVLETSDHAAQRSAQGLFTEVQTDFSGSST
jgi:hypothetical protein